MAAHMPGRALIDEGIADGIHRHRRRGLPRHARAPGGQAGDGGLLPGARGRARDRGVRLPAGGRRRHEPPARVPLHQLGHRAMATWSACRTTPRRGTSRGCPGRPWSSATCRTRRARRSRCRPARCCGASSSGRPSGGCACAARHRARVLPVPGLLRGGGRGGVAGPDAAHVDHRGLPAAADGTRGVHPAPHPQRDAGPPTSRSSSPRARPAGASTRSTSPTTKRSSTADRHLVFKNGIKEIAAQEGRAATFMAKWTMDDVGLVVPRAHEPVGPQERRAADGRRVAPERAVDPGPPVPGRPAPRRPASWPGAPRRR